MTMAPVVARGEGQFQVVRSSRGQDEAAKGMLSCPACAQDRFDVRAGVMDTRGASFFGWTWANRGSTELICRSCLYVMTFADKA